ncbi:MAG: hypothetical protein AB7F41_15775 [Methylocystis sp.]|uniref:hypothetical protein n=1 Tax=Methylocystis sp. TaxID=1911079 RepID=UPI003D09AD67
MKELAAMISYVEAALKPRMTCSLRKKNITQRDWTFACGAARLEPLSQNVIPSRRNQDKTNQDNASFTQNLSLIKAQF